MGIDWSCYFTSEVPPPDPNYDFIAMATDGDRGKEGEGEKKERIGREQWRGQWTTHEHINSHTPDDAGGPSADNSKH